MEHICVSQLINTYIHVRISSQRHTAMAVPRLMRLIAGASLWGIWFNRRYFLVEFMALQVALRQAVLWVFPFSPVSIISPIFQKYFSTHHQNLITLLFYNVVKQHIFNPPSNIVIHMMQNIHGIGRKVQYVTETEIRFHVAHKLTYFWHPSKRRRTKTDKTVASWPVTRCTRYPRWRGPRHASNSIS